MSARAQQAGQRGQDCPVSPGQWRRLDLVLEYGDPMRKIKISASLA